MQSHTDSEIKEDTATSYMDGCEHLRYGNYLKAKEIFEKRLKTAPDQSAEAGSFHLSLGDCYREMGKNENAIIEYKTAIDIFKPYLPIAGYANDSVISYAKIAHLSKEYQNAEKFYKMVLNQLKQPPSDNVKSLYRKNYPFYNYQEQAQVLRKLGDLYFDQKKYSDAEACYSQDITFLGVADQASAFRKLGKVYQVMGRYEEAMKAYKEAYRLEESRPGKHPMWKVKISNCIGSLLVLENKLERAKKYLEESILSISENCKDSSNRYLIDAQNWLAKAKRPSDAKDESIILGSELVELPENKKESIPLKDTLKKSNSQSDLQVRSVFSQLTISDSTNSETAASMESSGKGKTSQRTLLYLFEKITDGISREERNQAEKIKKSLGI